MTLMPADHAQSPSAGGRDRSRGRLAGVALLLAIPPSLFALPMAISHLAMLVRRLFPASRPEQSLRATLLSSGEGVTSLGCVPKVENTGTQKIVGFPRFARARLAAISCLLAVAAVLVATTALPRLGDRPRPSDSIARAAVVMGCLALVSILLWVLLSATTIPGRLDAAPR
jgi:hypothetical protein